MELPQNAPTFIFVTLEVSKLAEKVKEVRALISLNILVISVTLEVLKLAGRAKEVSARV